ncbi:major facilitator superfamily domain-containing protein [Mycena galopus ATCC 62051]|nr:major facilitator superfamily domain-containing protein [Mycena galopus ATCC 62051]
MIETPIRVHSNPNYLDGPWRAWSTVIGTFIVQFYVVGVITAFGVFQDFYTREWLNNCSASTISWIGWCCVTYFFELGCAPIGGKLYDAGFGRSSVWFGSFLSMLSFFLLSLAKPYQYYQVLLSQGVGMGIGLMLVFGPSMTMVSEHFHTRRGLAMGIVAAASPVGAIVFTIVPNHLFHSSIGFTWGIRAMGFMSLGCFIIRNALICTPRKPTERTNEPSSIAPPAPIWDLPYILILISGFVWSLGANTPNFYIQLYASTKDINQTLVYDSFAILSFGSIFGRILPGWMADRRGAANVFVPSLVALGLMCFAMLGCNNASGLVIFALIYGYFFGTIISIYLPMIRDLTPDGTNMGTRRMGYALSPIGIGMTVGPPMIGAILSGQFIWWRTIVASAVIVLAAACLNAAARYIHISRRTVAATTPQD